MKSKKLKALFYMTEDLGAKEGYPNAIEQEQYLYRLSRLGGYRPVAKIIHRGDINLIKSGAFKEIKEVIEKYDIDIFVCAGSQFLTKDFNEINILCSFLGHKNVKIHLGGPVLCSIIATLDVSDEKVGEELYKPFYI